jgi:hypothetical protein
VGVDAGVDADGEAGAGAEIDQNVGVERVGFAGDDLRPGGYLDKVGETTYIEVRAM